MSINMTDLAGTTLSREAEIDRRLEEIAGKMVRSSATPQERSEFQRLADERANLMRPPICERIAELRRSAA